MHAVPAGSAWPVTQRDRHPSGSGQETGVDSAVGRISLEAGIVCYWFILSLQSSVSAGSFFFSALCLDPLLVLSIEEQGFPFIMVVNFFC